MTYIWFWVHWLEEHAPKSFKNHFSKFDRLTGKDPSEEVKIILKLFILTRRPVLGKNQGWLSKREKLLEIFSSHAYTLILYHESITNCISLCSYSYSCIVRTKELWTIQVKSLLTSIIFSGYLFIQTKAFPRNA